MASAVADWLVIAAVVVAVIAVYFAILHTVDQCIEFWRAHRDAGPTR